MFSRGDRENKVLFCRDNDINNNLMINYFSINYKNFQTKQKCNSRRKKLILYTYFNREQRLHSC